MGGALLDGLAKDSGRSPRRASGTNLADTLTATLGSGFGIGGVLGIVMAAAMAEFPHQSSGLAVFPMWPAVQSLPKVAIAPALMSSGRISDPIEGSRMGGDASH